MSWALELLELDASADERAIKRAYARLLRSNRPDDDAEAFQQLHAAYQTALAWYRERQHQQPPDSHHQEALAAHAPAFTPATVSTDAPAAIAPGADAPPLHEDLLPLATLPQHIASAASRLDEDGFAQWLQQRPELWSLSAKQLIARPLAELLFNAPDIAMGRDNFEQITEAFGWNQVDGPIDAYALLRLREQLHARWLADEANELALLAELRRVGPVGVTLPEVRKRRRLLTRPWRPLPALFSALDPSRVTAMKTTLQVLAPDEVVQPPVQPEQVRFWDDVAREDRLTRNRLKLGLLRGALAGCLWLLLPLAVYLMEAAKPDKPTPDPTPLLTLGTGGFVLILALGIGWLPWKLGLQWLLAPTRRGSTIPLAAVVALALIRFTDHSLVGSFLAAGTLWLSFTVTFRNQPNVVRYAPLLLFAVYLAASALPTLKAPYGQLSAFLAAALSALDSWRGRRTSR